MELSYIKEFVTLAETLNYSEASQILYISQSSLSKHIKSIEKELGVSLFQRTTRSMALTEAGNVYLTYARKILPICLEAQRAISAVDKRTDSALTIGVIQNPQYYNLAGYMLKFKEDVPELTFNLIESDEAGLLDLYKRKKINLFTGFPYSQDKPKYNFMPMVSSEIVVLFHKDHPYAGRETVSLQSLRDESLLLPAHNSTISRVILEAFYEKGINPKLLYEGSSIGCLDLVKGGLGVSLHSTEFASTVTDDSIYISKIEPPIEFTYGLCSRELDELTDAERHYIEYMKIYEI